MVQVVLVLVLVPVETSHVSSLVLPAHDATEPVQVENKAVNGKAITAKACLQCINSSEVLVAELRYPEPERFRGGTGGRPVSSM